ncbi:MAG: hypothetical protein IPG44_12920 [Anaerolineales bacterium]|nr:hypothetical protein [Anaerolineales bacterium]
MLVLMDAPRESLTTNVYNVAAFAITAEEFRQRAVKAFPNAGPLLRGIFPAGDSEEVWEVGDGKRSVSGGLPVFLSFLRVIV